MLTLFFFIPNPNSSLNPNCTLVVVRNSFLVIPLQYFVTSVPCRSIFILLKSLAMVSRTTTAVTFFTSVCYALRNFMNMLDDTKRYRLCSFSNKNCSNAMLNYSLLFQKILVLLAVLFCERQSEETMCSFSMYSSH